MTTDKLKDALRAVPFRSFSLRTADGREFQVSHPEAVALSPGGRTVALFTPDDKLEIVDLLLVASISISPEPQKKRRKAG